MSPRRFLAALLGALLPLALLPPARRPSPGRASSSPTSPPPPASASATTPAPSARSTCRRRWAPASRSSTTTTTAGRTSSSSTARAGRARPGPTTAAALYRNNRNGTFTDVTRAAGLAVADVRDRRRRRPTTTTTAATTSTSRRSAATACSATRATARSRTSRAGRASRDPGIFARARCCSTTTRTGTLDLFVANYVDVDDRQGPLLHARRQDEVVLHARVLQGGEPDPLPQPRRRHVRGRDPQGRPVGPDRARRSASRSSTTTSDGWLDFFVANDTQPNKLYRNNRQRHVHRRRR